jgi:hypothetical protein
VPVKSAGQQAVLMLHRTRALLIRQQTMLANAFRAHLAEFGIVVAQGIRHVRALIEKVFGEDTVDLPALARTALRPLVAQLMELRLQIKTIEKELLRAAQRRDGRRWHRPHGDAKLRKPVLNFCSRCEALATPKPLIARRRPPILPRRDLVVFKLSVTFGETRPSSKQMNSRHPDNCVAMQ